MDGRIQNDLELDDIANICGFTKWGKEYFLNELNKLKPYKDIKRIQIPCMKFRLLPDISFNLKQKFHDINISLIDDILENKDPRVAESIEQIMWKENSIGSFLNTNSVWLNSLIFWKTLFLPFVAILMPVVAFIVPYVFLRFKQSPVDMPQYLEKLRTVILQQITVPVMLRSRSEHDIVGFLLERLFIGITLATFVASIWNQITPAIHLRNIWYQLEERGNACTKLMSWLNDCKLEDPAFSRLRNEIDESLEKIPQYDSPVATFAYFRTHKDELIGLKTLSAKIECYLVISGLERTCFSKNGPTNIVGLTHPLLPTCIPQIINCKEPHILLTGPNRGGKSTLLKSYGLAVLLSRTWGFAWATHCSIPEFKRLHIALTPAPILGKSSTFEAEIDAAKTICESSEMPQFVLMDEVFHSTNAIDGVAASTIFLNRLYAKERTTSIISTHYHDVAERFTDTVYPMMMLTEEKNGRIVNLYRAVKGVNKHSTVNEILRERGLMRSDL